LFTLLTYLSLTLNTTRSDKIGQFYQLIFSAKLEPSPTAEFTVDKICRQNQPILSVVCHTKLEPNLTAEFITVIAQKIIQFFSLANKISRLSLA